MTAGTPRVALTIAGSDSGGGAGIQADVKAFAAAGVFGTTAITAITAQSTTEVAAVQAIDADLVVAQILTVLSDLPVAAVKTGMLALPAIVSAVAELAAAGRLPNLVVDPVLISSTGYSLMEEGGVRTYRERLLPHALVVTPNLEEAAVLAGRPITKPSPSGGGADHADATVEAMVEAGRAIRQLGPTFVMVKGGHLEGRGSPDVVVGPAGVVRLEAERISTANDHGTGCSLSAGIAAGLALGQDPPTAMRRAKELVLHAIRGAADWRLGHGHGPIDHFGWGTNR